MTITERQIVAELVSLYAGPVPANPFPWSHVRLAVWDPAFGRLRA